MTTSFTSALSGAALCCIFSLAQNALAIHPQFFGLRWISLLLSQEFPLPDVLRLWDSLLSRTDRLSFLMYLCVAMLMWERGPFSVG